MTDAVQDPEIRLYDLRQRVRNGESVSAEEYAEVISAVREGRVNAASGGSKKKKKDEPTIDLPDDLNDLFKKPVSTEPTTPTS